MTDNFYITYHGSVDFEYGWVVIPKNVNVYLYNYPGYIYIYVI